MGVTDQLVPGFVQDMVVAGVGLQIRGEEVPRHRREPVPRLADLALLPGGAPRRPSARLPSSLQKMASSAPSATRTGLVNFVGRSARYSPVVKTSPSGFVPC
ncbi:hypothetical protein EKO27_g11803 [Xylaria grammica]|uniref:Uncharacterized protein n=1 Tax=Xylaria grammica TaxID=363999 RepID=A0A439CMB7_9PEZI|nr:hypothetical protein EKO27_g11803 [Xylaria grammica]